MPSSPAKSAGCDRVHLRPCAVAAGAHTSASTQPHMVAEVGSEIDDRQFVHGYRFEGSGEERAMESQVTLIRALVMLVPACMIFAGALTVFLRGKTPSSLLQLVGAGCLVVVVLAHICEALHLFPSMGWGLERSAGHYLDLGSAVLGLTLFPLGYVLHSLAPKPQ